MFNIVLYQPEIPPNTGNVIRLAANTACKLHLIEPLGFSMEDKQMRRAGLDYLDYAQVKRHADWAQFLKRETPNWDRCFAISTKGKSHVHSCRFQANDWLIFGSETSGLPVQLRETFGEQCLLKLPMVPGQRSLNLSNAVAIVVYEAWRQQGFAMPEPQA
ncbi:MAG: tRNA (uridine(34)/cytosine(34)/5-carboxymethylaminomethyluridine(34)-2'-O)-methyltransferase TrmL [Limnohabitans sp.]